MMLPPQCLDAASPRGWEAVREACMRAPQPFPLSEGMSNLPSSGLRQLTNPEESTVVEFFLSSLFRKVYG